jgi:hypothetical protein
MSIFDQWIDLQEEITGDKVLRICTEQVGGRAKITDALKDVMRSHYDDLATIADDISTLGYKMASAILYERLPQGKKGRSGDLGEILATEYTEQHLYYKVPIRRLRYKDGREMALRGDDFIGIGYDKDGQLLMLKGESKSAAALSNVTVQSARAALDRDHGRCTPHALLFVADRLLSGKDKDVGTALKIEVATKGLPPNRIAHAVFTLSGNAPLHFLRNDLAAADANRRQISINLHIADHQNFIAKSYLDLHDLGNS